MKKLIFFVIVILMCSVSFASSVIWDMEEDKKQEILNRDLIRELGYNPDAEDSGDVLNGPGINAGFNEICEFIKKHLHSDADIEEKKQFYILCGIASPSVFTDVEIARFSRSKIVENVEARNEREAEAEAIKAQKKELKEKSDEEKYGFVNLTINEFNIDKDYILKGQFTPLSLLKKAGLTYSMNKSVLGGYVTKIENLKETANSGWVYYVNGEFGTIAADKYQCKRGDNITWEYLIW